MRRDSRLTTITEALQTGPGNNRRAHRIWGRASTAVVDDGACGNVWAADVHDLALHVFTRLYGRPSTEPQLSPLAQAEDAKRRRDIEGEIGALMQGSSNLASAPWYPARRGDVVCIHYEQAGDLPAFGETYVVDELEDGWLSMRLLAHSPLTHDRAMGSIGCFAVEASQDPLMVPWMEAGPQRLTIIRDGRVVHDGGAR